MRPDPGIVDFAAADLAVRAPQAGARIRHKVGVVVPTLNAGEQWQEWMDAFDAQSCQPEFKLVIDSSSEDGTVDIARKSGFDVIVIEREQFDHGGTRLMGARLLKDADILVFLTQDAILASNDALEKLVRAFEDPKIGSAYGRQLPAKDATVLAAHHRRYNYSEGSYTVTKKDLARLGVRGVYCSNSFAAYRREHLFEVGGFKPRSIMGEDMLAAYSLIDAGYAHRYCAKALVYHSHNFTLGSEFKRYFDTGVFHRSDSRIHDLRASTQSEGVGFVWSEIRHSLRESPWLAAEALLRNAVRYSAYQVGRMHRLLPVGLKRRISNCPSYWR